MRKAGGSWGGLLLVGLLGCTTPASGPTLPETSTGISPLLWFAQAPDSGGGFYLLGSVHMGTDRMRDLGPEVAEAYDASEELVVEVDVSKVDMDQVVSLAQRYGRLEPPKTLGDVISDPTHVMLHEYLETRGLEIAEIEKLKPWFVSSMIAQHELQAAGFQPELGVDLIFINRAQSEKPIVALETIASQLELFDRLSPSLQELMLRDVLGRADHFKELTEKLIDAWRSGDEERLSELVFTSPDEVPELEVFYDVVFFRRNASMVERLDALSGDGRTRFVVLGAGHMLGPQGIPSLLRKRAYRVQRVGAVP